MAKKKTEVTKEEPKQEETTKKEAKAASPKPPEERVVRVKYKGVKKVKRFLGPSGKEYAFGQGESKLVPYEDAEAMLSHPDVFVPWTVDTLPPSIRQRYERAVEALKRDANRGRETPEPGPSGNVTRAEFEKAVGDLKKQIKALERKVRALL